MNYWLQNEGVLLVILRWCHFGEMAQSGVFPQLTGAHRLLLLMCSKSLAFIFISESLVSLLLAKTETYDALTIFTHNSCTLSCLNIWHVESAFLIIGKYKIQTNVVFFKLSSFSQGMDSTASPRNLQIDQFC